MHYTHIESDTLFIVLLILLIMQKTSVRLIYALEQECQHCNCTLVYCDKCLKN